MNNIILIPLEDRDRAIQVLSFLFARHGRALTGESPEHAQIVGSV